jgi:hypothetical protein
MIGRLTLLLMLALLLHGLALRGASSVRLLANRLERIEAFITSLEGTIIELPE